MADPVLFLTRPASEGTLLALQGDEPARLEPVWRLLLTAVFAAGAALTFATVVIFGAPDDGARDHPVRIAIAAPIR